jgi:hypothetical protein
MNNTGVVAADNLRDVLNAQYTGNFSTGANLLRMMLGSGTTPAASNDYRIQTPLYTQPDILSYGIISFGAGNQITYALTGAHTFAGATAVYEAGMVYCIGSLVTYLTGNNFQASHDVFTVVNIPAGGTFTGTWAWTEN